MSFRRYLQTVFAAFTLCTLMQVPLAASLNKDPDDDCCHRVKKINEKQKCQYVIHAKDITTTGFTIAHSGSWCLDGDIEFNPPNLGTTVQAAITIQAGVSDVILNLGNHRISQVGVNTNTQTPYVIGILVPDPNPGTNDPNFVGAQSIYIQGDQAIIDGFSMYGVRIFGHISDVRLSDLTIKNCGILASKLHRPNPNYFPHSNTVTGFGVPFGVAGLAIGESAQLGMGPTFFTQKSPPALQNRLKSINIENVSCLDNFYNGLVVLNSSDIVINNCHVDGTFSDDPGIPTTPGPGYNGLFPNGGRFEIADIDFPGVDNMVVSNSSFNNTLFGSGLASDFFTPAIGAIFAAEGVHNAFNRSTTFTNCQFNNTTSTFVGGTVLNFGDAGNENSTFVNCSFDGARGVTGVQGFHISGNVPSGTKSSRNTLLVNCTANNNQETGNLRVPNVVNTGAIFPPASGFGVYYAKNVTFENCEAQDIIANGPAAATTGAFGFIFNDAAIFPISPTPGNDSLSENVVVRNCIASRCLALNGGQARGFSFYNVGSLGNPLTNQTLQSYSIENCVSCGNQTFPGTAPVPGTQSIACGFYVEQNPETSVEVFRSWPISFTDCKAMHNKGTPSAPYAVPASGKIYSAGYFLLNAQRHSLTGCQAEDNVYGVLLEQCDRCTVRNCQADNNLDIASGVGAGFTDLGTPGTPAGTLGTPASPGLSTSLFESNRAFANGANQRRGANGNYNVLYGTTLVPLRTLNGNLTKPKFPKSKEFQPTINVSMRK